MPCDSHGTSRKLARPEIRTPDPQIRSLVLDCGLDVLARSPAVKSALSSTLLLTRDSLCRTPAVPSTLVFQPASSITGFYGSYLAPPKERKQVATRPQAEDISELYWWTMRAQRSNFPAVRKRRITWKISFQDRTRSHFDKKGKYCCRERPPLVQIYAVRRAA